ncbi:solute carrier organic anion transporter family member 3A1-like [Mytilus trossulus]|uniref:solute carrier organic anion transporter family member 3A1-like n=1 Tax=Mytilus trossulus TaxID=6551 RepID=UPI0030067965
MTSKTQCGIGRFTPDCLQCFAKIKFFAIFYSIAALVTSTLSVYIASQITTLEKQFGFTSTQSGLLMSCNDIGYLAVTLFVSYFAEKVHPPRVLSFSTILFGAAGLICAIPYFMSQMHSKTLLSKSSNLNRSNALRAGMAPGQLCRASSAFIQSNSAMNCSSNSNPPASIGVANDFTPVAMAIIAIGMIIQGIGKSPRQAFVTTYIDNNVDKTKTAVYVGGIMAVAIFGPALGFGLGGLFSRMYVTLEDVDISPRDPRWIGAWWVGFLTFGAGSLITALPVMCFPKRFHEKTKETKEVKNKRKTRWIVGFFKAIYALFRNKFYMLILFRKCLTLIIVSGSIAFGSKYVETQFSLPAWQSNLALGIGRIMTISIGTFIGGYFTSKKKLSPLGCSKFIFILSFFTMANYAIIMFLGCETPEIIGYNRKLSNTSNICVDNCNCNSEEYFPVCGSDNNNYFSLCHAGCTSSMKGFTNCTCIGATATAQPGLCSTDCPMFFPYIIVSCVFGIIESFGIMPSLIFMMRSVKEKQKGIAVGFSAFISTFGWFLGPVIFGEVIDMCCEIWSSRCGVKGSCALYDNVNFRYGIFGFCLILSCFIIILDLVNYLIARKKTDWNIGNTGRKNELDIIENQGCIDDGGDDNNKNIQTVNEKTELTETMIFR